MEAGETLGEELHRLGEEAKEETGAPLIDIEDAAGLE